MGVTSLGFLWLFSKDRVSAKDAYILASAHLPKAKTHYGDGNSKKKVFQPLVLGIFPQLGETWHRLEGVLERKSDEYRQFLRELNQQTQALVL